MNVTDGQTDVKRRHHRSIAMHGAVKIKRKTGRQQKNYPLHTCSFLHIFLVLADIGIHKINTLLNSAGLPKIN